MHSWMGVLFGRKVARRASAERRWDFAQTERGKAVRGAARHRGLASLRPCLYQCRHGGAFYERL
eukprot:7195419-Heterocapsa_arctica.AAC.1